MGHAIQPDDNRSWPCPHCGYDLRGTVDLAEEIARCPECGRTCEVIDVLTSSPALRYGRRMIVLVLLPVALFLLVSAVAMRIAQEPYSYIEIAGDYLLLIVLVSPIHFGVLAFFAARHHRSVVRRGLFAFAFVVVALAVNLFLLVVGIGVLEWLLR
jgi:hypothetical protein